MSRVEAASGAKYSSHKEQPRKFEPIAPVGSSYTPVGRPDIAALKQAPPIARPAPPPATSRPAFSAAKSPASAGSLYGRTVIGGTAPADAWPEESPPAAAAPPPPATSRPPVVPSASRPAFSAMTPKAFSAAPSPPPQPTAAVVPPPALTSNVPTRPAEEERIEPAKSAYTPVNLPAPKKLKNPFAAMEQQQSSTPSPSTPNSGKKLTWSERQALAKKQVEEEEARSRSAAFVPSVATPTANPVFKSSAPAFGRSAVTPSAPRNFGAIGAAAGAGVAIGATAAAFSATSTPPPPPPP